MTDENVDGPVKLSIRIAFDDEAVQIDRNLWMKSIESDNGFSIGVAIADALNAIRDDWGIFADQIVAGIIENEEDSTEIASGSIKKVLALFYPGSSGNLGTVAKHLPVTTDDQRRVAHEICHETEDWIEEKYQEAASRLRLARGKL
ncbi:MAG: hypothetical protein BIFFINMI_00949 [Phycisphaerae bacterium]|nr:hypothetical protein [Phycisphaerae bacterium]